MARLSVESLSEKVEERLVTFSVEQSPRDRTTSEASIAASQTTAVAKFMKLKSIKIEYFNWPSSLIRILIRFRILPSESSVANSTAAVTAEAFVKRRKVEG